MAESTTSPGEGVEDGAHRALERLPLPQLRPGDYTGQSNAMNDTATKPRLSQESITMLSVGGVLLGTVVALSTLILNTTGRIEHRIERVEHRIKRVEDRLLAVEKETASLRVEVERVEDRLLAVERETASLRVEVERVVERMLGVEKETASLRVDVTELHAGLDRQKAAAAGAVTGPSASTS